MHIPSDDEVRNSFKFETGQFVVTSIALSTLNECEVTPFRYLLRHKRGDWGDLGAEDKAANERAIKTGDRILSAYVLPNKQRIYIITEWDRSLTTLLMTDQY